MNSAAAQTISDKLVVENLLELSQKFGTDRQKPMTLTDVIGIAEAMTTNLQPLLRRIDVTLQTELRGILVKIEQLRSEISKVHATDISINRIPEVGKELDEVVRATETATNSIMESAEKVLAADGLSEAEYRSLVEAEMMKIFESCSFQDITGQRVNKVVETIKVIEERINMLCSMIDASGVNGDEAMTDREKSQKAQLLNGPSSDGAGQSEIDAMF